MDATQNRTAFPPPPKGGGFHAEDIVKTPPPKRVHMFLDNHELDMANLDRKSVV